METAIRVEQLSKTYSTFSRREGIVGSIKDLLHREYSTLTAVDSISFEVKAGELIGYIGPNGAGKSTSIKMLTGILQPTSGSIDVFGYHPFNDRKRYTQHIGVVFGQRTQLWWDIAVRESFALLGTIYDVDKREFENRLAQLTEIFNLEEVISTPVRKLSLGQRMRCDLAASLLHNPKVLFLDEPTIGLDAVAKDGIRSFLRKINKEFGTTIILTTHDLKEIEELCDRIVILDHGKILYDGGLREIKGIEGLQRTITIDFTGAVSGSELLASLPESIELKQQSARRVLLSYDQKQTPTAELVRSLFASSEVADLTISEPDIEQVIMKIYREGL